MKILFATTAAAALLSAPAHADDVYAKVFGGVGLGVDQDFDAQIAGVGPVSGEIDTDIGYDVGGALGYQLNDLFAVEAEVAYRSNDISGGTVAGAPFSASGDIDALSFMGNAVLTLPGSYGLTPYGGVGVGTAGVGGDGERDYVFAYQGFAGLKRDLTDRISAGVEYRYFGSEDATFSNAVGTLSTDYSAHNINFVLTRRF